MVGVLRFRACGVRALDLGARLDAAAGASPYLMQRGAVHTTHLLRMGLDVSALCPGRGRLGVGVGCIPTAGVSMPWAPSPADTFDRRLCFIPPQIIFHS